MTSTRRRIVDVHAHSLLPEVEAAVGGHPGLLVQRALEERRNGEASSAQSRRMVLDCMPSLTDLGQRLAQMDAAGVDVQVLSPSPSQYHYYAEPELALTLCRIAAEGVTALVAQAPNRLAGLGLVPLQHPELCAGALDTAMSLGLNGVEISSHAPRPADAVGGPGSAPVDGAGNTIELSDPALEPFWGRAAETGAVIFLHPFGCTLDERLNRWYLSNTVGQPVENAVALSHLVFAGVLDRHPTLRIIAAHGGGYLPTYLGRSDHAWAVRPEARGCADPPSSYLRRLWFDSLVHSPESLRSLVKAVGADRVLLGSDYPFDMGVTDPVERVRAADLSDYDTDLVLGGNATSLGLLPSAQRGVAIPVA